MDLELFTNRITRNPEGHRKYLILEGARAGWVMPGGMLLTREQGFGLILQESVIPINPVVSQGDRVLPLKMRESRAEEGIVASYDPKYITLNGWSDRITEWVVLPPDLPEQDKELFLLQIREHLLLAGYEEESRRRGWHDFWRDVNESAGFVLRPVPATVIVRARWRVGRYDLANFVQPERMAEIVAMSDEVVLSHVTTDHTVLLPNLSADCRCREHARVLALNTEITSGPGFRQMSDLLTVGLKSRMDLHSVEVRAINCPYGQSS